MNELNIKYRYNIKKYLIVLDFKKSKSFLHKIKTINEISINKIFAKDIEEPAMIEIGNMQNKSKK